MGPVYQLTDKVRLIDLSKPIDPETETRRCSLHRFNTGGLIPDFHTNVDIMTHLGTHVECPYHHDDNWPDVMGLPLTTFMGRAIILDFSELAPRAYITPADLEKREGEIRAGDIVILDSGYQIPPFTPMSNTDKDLRLRVNGETARWLADKKVKCVGFGLGVSVESSNEDIKPFHDILMAENVVFLEVIHNLDRIQEKVFFMSYTPLPIKGLDSSPVRAFALEGLAEFSD